MTPEDGKGNMKGNEKGKLKEKGGGRRIGDGSGRMQGTLSRFIPGERAEERVKIVVDHREAASQTVEELRKLGACLEMKSLKVGDYVISDEIAVERKTYGDFAASIIDRRLFEQARALKEAYGRPVLMLEEGDRISGVSREAMRGALLSVILDYGIPVLVVEGAEEGAGFLMAMAKREQRGTREISLKDRRRATTPDGEREYVVASLPLVESTTARRLLTTFRTVQGVFSASEEELQKVEKIGPKKAKRIRELLSGEYGAGVKSSCGPSQGDHK